MSDPTNISTNVESEEARMVRYLADNFPADPDADPRLGSSPTTATDEDAALDAYAAVHFAREPS